VRRRPSLPVAAVAATLVVAVAAAGCVTTYQPRPGPRISRVTGNVTFVREGRTYNMGLLGGGAEELVAGDARAVEYARAYHRRMRLAGILYITGLVAIVAGAAIESSNEGSLAKGAGAGLFAAGVVSSLPVSLYLISTGAPLLTDAVNVYNDDLERR
jgi:hypothetical protein